MYDEVWVSCMDGGMVGCRGPVRFNYFSIWSFVRLAFLGGSGRGGYSK